MEQTMTEFVYHMLRHELRGTELLPLSTIQERDEAWYEQCIARYEGRLGVTRQRIELLDCAWRDVVFFSPVDPNTVFAAVSHHAGIRISRRWYLKIPVDRLAPATTVIWNYEHDDVRQDEIEPFSVSALARVAEGVPAGALDFFRRKQANAPYFGHVPHVMHKGSVLVHGCQALQTDEY